MENNKLKPSIIGYHSLHKNDEIKLDIKPLQEKTTKSVLDYMKEIVEKTREAYEKDNEEGTLIKSFYTITEQQDVELLKYLHNKILEEEPVIAKKSDFAQMIILTKIIIDLHFKLIVLIDDVEKIKKLTDAVALLRFDLKPEVWLEAYRKYVLPVLSELFTVVGSNLDEKYIKKVEKEISRL